MPHILSSLILLSLIHFSSFSYAQAQLSVDVTLKPAGSFKAQTDKISGKARHDNGKVSAENVVIDLRTLSTGIALRDKHLKERLLVDKYPEAKLIKAVGKDGKGKAVLEIKGSQQQVEGTYTLSENVLKAKFPMHLPKLDIKGVKYMGVGVADDVTVNITLPVDSEK